MTHDTATSHFERKLPLPPARLWALLTDARHREKWGVPDPSMVLVVETSDLRVGGQDRHRCGPAEAPEFMVDTRWYQLTGPDRAVFTETLIFGGEPVSTSLVTYVLTAAGTGTNLHVIVATSSFTGPEALAEIEQGWTGGLDNLVHYASQIGSPT